MQPLAGPLLEIMESSTAYLTGVSRPSRPPRKKMQLCLSLATDDVEEKMVAQNLTCGSGLASQNNARIAGHVC